MGNYLSQRKTVPIQTLEPVRSPIQSDFVINPQIAELEKKIEAARGHLKNAYISNDAAMVLRYKSFVLPHLHRKIRVLIDEDIVRLQEFIVDLKKQDMLSDTVQSDIQTNDDHMTMLQEKSKHYQVINTSFSKEEIINAHE